MSLSLAGHLGGRRHGVMYVARALVAAARDPLEAVERVRERRAEQRDRSVLRPARPTADQWGEALHTLLEAPWQCPDEPEFWAVWSAAAARLAKAGLALGRGAYGGWDDADPAFARALWCAVLHLRPRSIVETGVARGLTSRVALEALQRTGAGRLASIDVPPLLERRLHAQTGCAVTPELRGRWRLIEGSSRRRLPRLVAELGTVDVFVHDSMHTGRNVRFELETVWPALSDGGLVLVDDVDYNDAFAEFAAAHGDMASRVAAHDDGRGLFGIAVKRRG